jgi:hypothetical protein
MRMTKPLQQLSREEAIAELALYRERLKGNAHLAPQRVRNLANTIERTKTQLWIATAALVVCLAGGAASIIALYRSGLGALWALIPLSLLSLGLIAILYFLKASLVETRKDLGEWQSALVQVKSRVKHDEVSELNIYRVKAEQIVEELRGKARQNRQLSNLLQITVIVGSIVVSTLAGIGTAIDQLKWANVSVAALVSICAGLGGFFKFRERSHSEQRTADSIEKEINHLDLGIGAYVKGRPESLKLFAAKVETLREEQRKAELQLDQNPESDNRAVPAAGA